MTRNNAPGGQPVRTGRAAFVATTGGHLVEMRLLATLLEPERHHDALWITHRTPQSESVLEGERVLFVDFVEARDIFAAARRAPLITRTMRAARVDAVYSTGAALALSALPAARLVGAPATYIESLTRPLGPSMTGRVLSLLPWIRMLTQYTSRAGRRWKYRMSLMDSFVTRTSSTTPAPRRVFVTFGTVGRYEFRRLLDRLVAILPADCDVVWQTGSTRVDGLMIDARPMMTDVEFQAEIARADVVVAHAGCGTFLRCLGLGKAPVMVPRRSAYDEHVDDHQEQLAQVAATRGLAVMREADQVTWDDLVQAAAIRVLGRESKDDTLGPASGAPGADPVRDA